MQRGVKFRAYPTDEQAHVLSQWIGCRRVIWNAKCSEEHYHRMFARKYCAIGTYAPIDKSYSQFKSEEMTPWLYDVPAEILKDAACSWAETYQRFIKGECGRPRLKKKSSRESVWLEKRLFQVTPEGELYLGTTRRKLGKLDFYAHRPWEAPKSVTITRDSGRWYISFSYDDGVPEQFVLTQEDHLTYLRYMSEADLAEMVVGLDRGIAIPVHSGAKIYDFTHREKARLAKEYRNRRRYQKRMAKQKIRSRRRQKTKSRLGRSFHKSANIRNDFAHKTSHDLTAKSGKSIFVFEDLKTKQMTAVPAAKPVHDATGKVISYAPNKAKAKAGLNRAILNVAWHKIEAYTIYKAVRSGKAWFKVSAFFTSQACAACDHTSEENRRSQNEFRCVSCGHTDNADANAAKVIAKQAIKLIQDPGTGLSKRGVLLAATEDVEPFIRHRGRKVRVQGAGKRQKRRSKADAPATAARHQA